MSFNRIVAVREHRHARHLLCIMPTFITYCRESEREEERQREKETSILLRTARGMQFAALTSSRDKTLCLHPLISSIFALRLYSRLHRVIASAIRSSRNYRAITRARIIPWANILVNRELIRVSSVQIEDSSNF